MQPAIDDPHALLATEIRFGPFRVFPGRRLLERQGTPVAIGGRALDLLVALLSRPGQILSKRELLQRVWPDTIVEEGSLRFHMTHLRRILGDDGATGGRYIATQVGVGYAFVAPVARVQAGVGDADPGAGDPGPPPPVRSALAALPTRPALIGRNADVQAVLGSLQEPRLVTIVGSGGVGKTSLAVDVGHAAAYDVVRFVDLAQIEDATLVASALAAAWGVPVQADDPVFVLLAHLQDARALLIIDNCEHLVEAVCAIVERLREAAPGVCVLATSREPLRARGEQLYWLGPLECPPADAQLSAPALMAYPAVRLFVERASLDDRQAPLEAEQLRMIADICLRLDGMALPIELAAVRAATHGIQATHGLLGERFALAWSGRRTALPRQQTLRATLDWSYGLLSGTEKLLFDRLAIFLGRFSLHAASEVASDARMDAVTVAATLDELVAKGLVTVEQRSDLASFRLLEMTRAYARERLAAHGDDEGRRLAFRHAGYYLELLGKLGRSPDAVYASTSRFACQLANLRSALEWSFGPDGDPGVALPLAAASVPVFLHSSLLNECRVWCSRAVELLELGYFGTRTEMELQAALGLVLMFTQGNSGAAGKALRRAMVLAEDLGDHNAQLTLLGRLQIYYERIGDFAASLAWAERAAAVGEAIGEAEAVAVASSLAGVSHHLLGELPLARQELEHALRNSGPSRRSQTLHYGFDHRNRTGLALARTLWLQGYPDQARQWALRVEAEAEALDHPVTHCIALVWTLCIHIWNGDLERAGSSLAAFTRIAEANLLAPYMAAVPGLRAAIAIRAGEPEPAIEWLQSSLDQLHGMRYELLTTSFEIALAEGLILAGRLGQAQSLLATTLAHCQHSGDAFALPELLRLQAGVRRLQGDAAQATRLLDEALALSRRQGARAWELRIVLDQSGLAAQQGDTAAAAAMLAACSAWVGEGFGTQDVRQWVRARRASEPDAS